MIHGDYITKRSHQHTGQVYLNGNPLVEAVSREKLDASIDEPFWYGNLKSRPAKTTLWARFKDVDPNEQMVEINVRQSVFYPSKEQINYITVRGFEMTQAAPNWAPPTAEQVGMVGTHWSKGWIIENNKISHSRCVGITLGKYGDELDNTYQNNSQAYTTCIDRALKYGWNGANVGHHLVRNNTIAHCGQAGIVGGMGAVFSTITGNVIHDIAKGQRFGGYETAGIKFHAPIDVIIEGNHIYRCDGHGGIWLDWMTQGTRVTRNVFHDNDPDLFVEVNHGPFLVDHNIFLSRNNLKEASGGGAYIHNLFGGKVGLRAEKKRSTPLHKPHSTAILGRSKIIGDDERFHNNLFTAQSSGLVVYNGWKPENLQAAGNVYLAGAKPSTQEQEALVVSDFKAKPKLEEEPDGWWLEMSVDPAWISKQKRAVVTTESLGKAKASDARFEQADGRPYRLDTDYFGNRRNTDNPAPGPFAVQSGKEIHLKVWPRK